MNIQLPYGMALLQRYGTNTSTTWSWICARTQWQKLDERPSHTLRKFSRSHIYSVFFYHFNSIRLSLSILHMCKMCVCSFFAHSRILVDSMQFDNINTRISFRQLGVWFGIMNIGWMKNDGCLNQISSQVQFSDFYSSTIKLIAIYFTLSSWNVYFDCCFCWIRREECTHHPNVQCVNMFSLISIGLRATATF